MGCKQSQENLSQQVEQMWASKRFPEVQPNLFENESEIKIFKTINLIRNDPKWAITHIKTLRNHKKYTGAKIEPLIQRLQNMQPLEPFEVSYDGNRACRKICLDSKNDVNPDCNKTQAAFLEFQREILLSNTKSTLPTFEAKVDQSAKGLYPSLKEKDLPKLTQLPEKAIQEYTEIGWEGPCEEIALFMLISDCQCHGQQDIALLDPKISKVGLAFQNHKKFISIFNILYIQDTKNININGDAYPQDIQTGQMQ